MRAGHYSFSIPSDKHRWAMVGELDGSVGFIFHALR